MKGLKKLRLTGGPTGEQTEVWLDGEKLHHVTHVSLYVGAEGIAEAVIRMLVEVDADIEAEVDL